MADSVIVMKDGKVVEQGTAEEIFSVPKADYTRALISASFSLKANPDSSFWQDLISVRSRGRDSNSDFLWRLIIKALISVGINCTLGGFE